MDRPVGASVPHLSVPYVDADDSIDLRAILMRLWRRRWWLAISVLLCGSVFLGMAYIMVPIYRSTTLFVPANIGRPGVGGFLSGALGSLGDLASLAGVNVGGGGTETEEALAVLKSRQFTEQFINDLRLMPELFPDKWDPVAQRWRPGTLVPTPAQAYKYFNNQIRAVQQDKKTGLITMTIDWRDRLEGASWANELLVRLNAEMRKRAIAKSDASVGYLEKELNTTTVVGTREAISRLIEAQIRQRMIANVTQEYAFRVVDKAIAPDNKDVLKPKKAIMLGSGLAVGFIGAVLVVLMMDGLGRDPKLPVPRA
jgi:uncharacterized protein involved in exopolysaccharide biosynthesis